jgi:hypothetical protein
MHSSGKLSSEAYARTVMATLSGVIYRSRAPLLSVCRARCLRIHVVKLIQLLARHGREVLLIDWAPELSSENHGGYVFVASAAATHGC